MEIDGSAGMISRIESDKVNPSKETINDIAKVLKLNKREIDYMIGASANPVSEKEIEAARGEVGEYFSRLNVFAYLICDRQRIWLLSRGFYKMFAPVVDDPEKVSREVQNGSQIIRIMLDSSLGINTYLDQESLKEMLCYNLSRFYLELDFITDDENITNTIKMIESHPIAGKIWDRIKLQKEINTTELDSRTATFMIHGLKVRLRYGREYLNSNPRFEVIEYVPTNRLIKLLSRF